MEFGFISCICFFSELTLRAKCELKPFGILCSARASALQPFLREISRSCLTEFFSLFFVCEIYKLNFFSEEKKKNPSFDVRFRAFINHAWLTFAHKRTSNNLHRMLLGCMEEFHHDYRIWWILLGKKFDFELINPFQDSQQSLPDHSLTVNRSMYLSNHSCSDDNEIQANKFGWFYWHNLIRK